MSPDAQTPKPTASHPTAATNYAPSVPISVYRELAAEFQAQKAMLDSLNTQNQHLVQQNQKLRQEIEKLVQSALQVRQTAETMQPMGWNPTMPIPQELAAEAGRAKAPRVGRPERSRAAGASDISPMAKQRPTLPATAVLGESYVMEHDEKRPWSGNLERSSDLNSLWLVLAIIAIVATAFGAGFLIVRPFLPNPGR